MEPSGMTPENLNVTRSDIQALVIDNTSIPNITIWLQGRGLGSVEIKKIIGDLGSYA